MLEYNFKHDTVNNLLMDFEIMADQNDQKYFRYIRLKNKAIKYKKEQEEMRK